MRLRHYAFMSGNFKLAFSADGTLLLSVTAVFLVEDDRRGADGGVS